MDTFSDAFPNWLQAPEAEVFLNPDGSLYHIGVKSGEINQRILTVGDRERAELIAAELLEDVKHYNKTRNFHTFSGTVYIE